MYNTVILSTEEYNKLKGLADQTKKYMEEEYQKKLEQGDITVRLRLESEFENGTGHLIHFDSYDDIKPRLRDMIVKVHKWAENELADVYERRKGLNAIEMQIKESKREEVKWFWNALVGWALFIVLFGIIIAYMIFHYTI